MTDIRLIVNRIWQRAYLDTEEDCAKWIQEYVNEELQRKDKDKDKDKDIESLKDYIEKQELAFELITKQQFDEIQQLKKENETLAEAYQSIGQQWDKAEDEIKQLKEALREIIPIAVQQLASLQGWQLNSSDEKAFFGRRANEVKRIIDHTTSLIEINKPEK